MRTTGALTFAFTDIERSTELWERAPDDMRVALARHDALVREAIAAHDGRVFATGGDGVAAVFARATDAVAAAMAAQRGLRDEPWPAATPIRVRIGVHTGEAEERDGDYFGATLNRAARLMSIAHGGQIVCSGVTAAMLDRDTRLLTLGEHRLRDLSAPMPVFQVGDGAFPPLRSLDSVPSNLPTMASDLVGRTDELRGLVTEVHRHRVVTLTGVGGVGKTRLALAVGGAVAPDFVDGCWLAELAPVADGGDVVRTVIAALGASSVVAGDRDALLRYVEHRRLVLVLDNCEHVLDAVADLVDELVAGAPDVRVIATSREPLGVDSEVVRRVRSLDEDAAVRLFVERARAADGDFVLGAGDADAVDDICRHLDGIPLAIELAAARVRAMAPAEISRRLDDRFRMLTGGRRAQERHRTLQAAVGWSYDLLTEDDRRAFACLSVFPATFDLAAASAIVGDDAVEAVVRLVERSLVVHDSGTGRYRLLETLRQYGADRLVELGDSGAARERYARHFLDLVARHGPAVSDHRHDDAVTALQADLENLRATADWLTRESRWREVHAFCVDGSAFFSQFIAAEALLWLASVLDNAPPEDALASSDALGLAAMYAVNGEQFDRGLRFAERSLDVASRGGAVASPWAHFAICMSAAVGVLPAEQGQRHTAAMERAASERGEPFLLSVAKSLAVMFATRLGELGDVDRLTDEALAAALPLRNRTATSVALVTVAGALMFDRDPPEMERARSFLDAHAEEGLGAYGGLNVAWLLTYRAFASYDRDPAAAARDALESARFADRTGSEFATVCALEVLTAVCAQLGLAHEAAALGGHLSTRGGGLPVNSTYRSLVARRAAAVDSVRSGSALAAPPVDRRALLALLARIERAIEEGTTPSERCVPT